MRYTDSLKVPRITPNLLSVISMMLICALLCTTCLPALANDCSTERENVEKKRAKVKEKENNVKIKGILLAAAILTGNPVLIWLARRAYEKAVRELEEAKEELIDALLALLKCIAECEDDSGGTSS